MKIWLLYLPCIASNKHQWDNLALWQPRISTTIWRSLDVGKCRTQRSIVLVAGSGLFELGTRHELIKRVVTNNMGEGNHEGNVLSNETSTRWHGKTWPVPWLPQSTNICFWQMSSPIATNLPCSSITYTSIHTLTQSRMHTYLNYPTSYFPRGSMLYILLFVSLHLLPYQCLHSSTLIKFYHLLLGANLVTWFCLVGGMGGEQGDFSLPPMYPSHFCHWQLLCMSTPSCILGSCQCSHTVT